MSDYVINMSHLSHGSAYFHRSFAEGSLYLKLVGRELGLFMTVFGQYNCFPSSVTGFGMLAYKGLSLLIIGWLLMPIETNPACSSNFVKSSISFARKILAEAIDIVSDYANKR